MTHAHGPAAAAGGHLLPALRRTLRRRGRDQAVPAMLASAQSSGVVGSSSIRNARTVGTKGLNVFPARHVPNSSWRAATAAAGTATATATGGARPRPPMHAHPNLPSVLSASPRTVGHAFSSPWQSQSYRFGSTSASTSTSSSRQSQTSDDAHANATKAAQVSNSNCTDSDALTHQPGRMDLRRLYRYLALQTFTAAEMDAVFDAIYTSSRDEGQDHNVDGDGHGGEEEEVVDSYGNPYSPSGPPASSGRAGSEAPVGGAAAAGTAGRAHTTHSSSGGSHHAIAAVQVGVDDEGRGGTDVDDLEGRRMGEGTIGHADVASYLARRIRELDEVGLGRDHGGGDDGHGDDENHAGSQEEILRRYASGEAAMFLNVFREVSIPAESTTCPDTDKTGSSSLQPSIMVTKSSFRTHLLKLASEIDSRRTLPIAISMLLVGSSVGIVTPVMPFVVESIGLSPGQYGVVVSAFALAKIVGNVPSAILVERHGRKPYLVHSLLLVSLGVGGIGLASQFEHLFVCRLFTGLGVAALSTAATMTMADISTPLNRASTMAPIMSAFAAGTAFGPALGGLMADKLGISETFYVVGTSYLGLTLVNNYLLVETQAKAMRFPWHKGNAGKTEQESGPSMIEASKDAVRQWAPLMADGRIRNTVAMNGLYWVALAGSQMTILPLMLTDPNGLALSATAVGKTYMGMSLVQVAGVPLMAKFVDRIGKPLAIVAGTSLISSSMAALPFCTDMYHMAAALGTWGLGSSILSTAPVSYISDVTSDKERAQALALMRTAGDVGFLMGASGIGAVADFTGDLGSAMHASAGVLLTATGWFAVRRVLSEKVGNE